MKPFRYRLEKILNYREYLEQKAHRELSEARNSYAEEKIGINRLVTERMETAQRCHEEEMKGMNVSAFQLYLGYLRGLADELEMAHQHLNELHSEVLKKERLLTERHLGRKILETLKEHRIQGYREECTKEEQNFLDEMVIIKRGVRQ